MFWTADRDVGGVEVLAPTIHPKSVLFQCKIKHMDY